MIGVSAVTMVIGVLRMIGRAGALSSHTTLTPDHPAEKSPVGRNRTTWEVTRLALGPRDVVSWGGDAFAAKQTLSPTRPVVLVVVLVVVFGLVYPWTIRADRTDSENEASQSGQLDDPEAFSDASPEAPRPPNDPEPGEWAPS